MKFSNVRLQIKVNETILQSRGFNRIEISHNYDITFLLTAVLLSVIFLFRNSFWTKWIQIHDEILFDKFAVSCHNSVRPKIYDDFSSFR